MTLATDKECPFGTEARFCEYQETRARDIPSAIKGELLFLCKLDNLLKDCPMFGEAKDKSTPEAEVTEPDLDENEPEDHTVDDAEYDWKRDKVKE